MTNIATQNILAVDGSTGSRAEMLVVSLSGPPFLLSGQCTDERKQPAAPKFNLAGVLPCRTCRSIKRACALALPLPYWKTIISVRLSVGACGFRGVFVRLELP